jgi:hypothetical protein
MTARRNPVDQGGLPARWPGTCCICHEDFPVGTPIAKVRGLPCHAECHRREKS